tara:strand:- start:113 stop:895 length:783 start_codon:yes stop_codon:yes gene_type:complete
MAGKERAAGNENDARWYDERAERYREQYLKRTKIDLATGEKVTNKAAKAARMKKVECGYCGQRGHTRRTCPAVKVDKQVFVEESRRVRIAALEAARETGIGLGSMVPIRSPGYENGEWRRDILTLRYVKSIEWESCCAYRPNLTVKHVDARKLGAPNQSPYTSQDQIAKLVQANGAALRYADAEGQDLPVSSLVPSLDPPKGWLQPTEQSLAEAIKRQFPTSGTKHNKQRGYDFAYPSGITREIIKDLGLTEHFPRENWT